MSSKVATHDPILQPHASATDEAFETLAKHLDREAGFRTHVAAPISSVNGCSGIQSLLSSSSRDPTAPGKKSTVLNLLPCSARNHQPAVLSDVTAAPSDPQSTLIDLASRLLQKGFRSFEASILIQTALPRKSDPRVGTTSALVSKGCGQRPFALVSEVLVQQSVFCSQSASLQT